MVENILKVLLLVLIAGITYGVFRMVFAKLPRNKYQEFLFTLEALAEYAELEYSGPGRGKEKLAYVLQQAAIEAQRLGVLFDPADAQKHIEEYVAATFAHAKKEVEDKIEEGKK